MKILLDDINNVPSLFPFGELRSVAHLQIGILSIFEKWDFYFPGKVEVACERISSEINESEYFIYPVNILPSHSFLKELSNRGTRMALTSDCKEIQHPWQLFEFNDWAIREDFKMLTEGKISEELPENTQAICPENIFIEAGAKIQFAILNATNGPIYIGKNAEIMEGSLLRGPISIGENSVVKMGTKIYGATSIGTNCVVGGEIKNSNVMDFSNKAHDGYLGDSVIGQWCNLGAGTSNSNLKNNVSPVKIWNKEQQNFEEAGIKCGLLMGDYSRAAINTSFNTGTVVGINCNIFGEMAPPKFIDNFTWGNETYEFEKAMKDIANWKNLKNQKLEEKEIQQLKKIYLKK
jgi:UDP-N-acetylglucosamine diphosphorylase/glucosamine-1-phosphate N-acetyltransferase